MSAALVEVAPYLCELVLFMFVPLTSIQVICDPSWFIRGPRRVIRDLDTGHLASADRNKPRLLYGNTVLLAL